MPTGFYPRPSLAERFWPSVDKTDTCWLWKAYTNPRGYGTIQSNGKNTMAHRVAYELLVGPVPEGFQLDHLCRVPNCVNPSHLEPVTLRENVLRGIGRTAQNARKTHCIHGHLFDERNTYYRPTRPTQRQCKRCNADQCAQRKQRLGAKP